MRLLQRRLLRRLLRLNPYRCYDCRGTYRPTLRHRGWSEAAEEEIIADQKAANAENVEDVTGIFEGLEDNHTAIFSFNGAETAFYFEDPAVQNVLFEAVIDSPYTLSYSYDDSLGYVIYKISE